MLGGVHALIPGVLAATVLTVPFVPQREDTCGPAALAMVLRYWGRPALHDELAAELVDPALHGTSGSRLAGVAREAGLRALAIEGDAEVLRDSVAKGRPVVVAWGLARGRFHNVVVVGLDGDTVVVHDPARGAARRIAAGRFEARWAAAGHWALIVAPEPAGGGGP